MIGVAQADMALAVLRRLHLKGREMRVRRYVQPAVLVLNQLIAQHREAIKAATAALWVPTMYRQNGQGSNQKPPDHFLSGSGGLGFNASSSALSLATSAINFRSRASANA